MVIKMRKLYVILLAVSAILTAGGKTYAADYTEKPVQVSDGELLMESYKIPCKYKTKTQRIRLSEEQDSIIMELSDVLNPICIYNIWLYDCNNEKYLFKYNGLIKDLSFKVRGLEGNNEYYFVFSTDFGTQIVSGKIYAVSAKSEN